MGTYRLIRDLFACNGGRFLIFLIFVAGIYCIQIGLYLLKVSFGGAYFRDLRRPDRIYVREFNMFSILLPFFILCHDFVPAVTTLSSLLLNPWDFDTRAVSFSYISFLYRPVSALLILFTSRFIVCKNLIPSSLFTTAMDISSRQALASPSLRWNILVSLLLSLRSVCFYFRSLRLFRWITSLVFFDIIYSSVYLKLLVSGVNFGFSPVTTAFVFRLLLSWVSFSPLQLAILFFGEVLLSAAAVQRFLRRCGSFLAFFLSFTFPFFISFSLYVLWFLSFTYLLHVPHSSHDI